jgi:hypothetical protein
MVVEINYLAVLLAGAASMLVGLVWYSRGAFGSSWAQLAGVDMDKATSGKEMARLLITVFLGSLVTAYVLAILIFIANNFFRNAFIQDALMTAFWVWLGFVALRIFTHDLFEGRRRKLTFITLGYELATFLTMGLVLGAFRP